MSSRLIVNSIRHTGASGDAVTLANDGTCTANITNRSNRNLIINGAMLVAQRGTSSTSTGYATVDRFRLGTNGVDEAPTQAQVDVASGTTPYTLGFRKALKITNGNQTSGAGTSDDILIQQKLEGQNVACSGWNYLSSSSNITLSFWVKSSVAQNFYFALISQSGTQKNYPMETGSLSADTWTKITKTIPGNSGITINNDNALGLYFEFMLFRGTDKTGSVNLNEWSTYSGSTRTPDQTSTWYTTNDATFELSGVQLEVSDYATDFEHRSYQDEFQRCERYYEQHEPSNFVLGRYTAGTGNGINNFKFRTMKRAVPTFTTSGTFASNSGYAGTPTASYLAPDGCILLSSGSISANQIVWLSSSNDTYGTRAKIIFSSEL